MSTYFNPQEHLIAVTVRLFGPTGDFYARLALDTGASSTVIRNAILTAIGYDLTTLPNTVQFTTGSGVEFAPRLIVNKIEALEHDRSHFSVIAHTLPPSASVDGVLGLDFFRNHVLTINFQNGEITLEL